MERCRIDAPWVGTGRAAAGVLHEGSLVLRDATGNECSEAGALSAGVQLWLREEFVREADVVPGPAHKGAWQEASDERRPRPSLALALAITLQCNPHLGPHLALALALTQASDEMASPDPRRLFPQQATHRGGATFHVVWQAARVGKHTLFAMAGGQLLKCSQQVETTCHGMTLLWDGPAMGWRMTPP